MKLGVNIDHVATLRQARRGTQPDVILAAKEAEAGGADSITVHLREDRRHIQDTDLPALKRSCRIPINLELALVPEIIRIALALKPEKVCIVPERRLEVTTEGGLNVIAKEKALKKTIPLFKALHIEVSLFIDPSPEQILKASLVGADAIEIHTGAYSLAKGKHRRLELDKIRQGSALAVRLGMKVHAGHGLDYDNVQPICGISEIEELNIGHSIVSHAVFWGLRKSVEEMKGLINLKSK